MRKFHRRLVLKKTVRLISKETRAKRVIPKTTSAALERTKCHRGTRWIRREPAPDEAPEPLSNGDDDWDKTKNRFLMSQDTVCGLTLSVRFL